MNKNKLVEYFIELLIVIVGVFLGMIATEWTANKNLNQDKKDILTGLKTELEGNLHYIEQRAKLQKVFFHSLDSLSRSLSDKPEVLNELFHDGTFNNRIPNWPGLGKPKLDDSMYEAAKFSNILPNLEIELLKQLSKTYHLQYNIDESRKVLGQQFFNIDSNSKYFEVLDFMWMITEDYFSAHYLLIEEYKKTINLIDRYNG